MANKIPLAIADLEKQLATSIAVGATTFDINNGYDDDAVALPAGMYCFTVDSGTSAKEYLLGQLNGTTVTSVKSVSRQGVETTGAARKHRIGAPVLITDFATIQRVADILRGQLALDGANPVGYDAEPTLADRKELATVGYVLDTVVGGTVAFDTMTVAGNGGEAIVAGNLVYFKTSDQEWYKTDADASATSVGVQLGIALGTGSDGAGISGGIQISGTWTTTGLTAGSVYYVSGTAGAITTTPGANSRVVGLALSTTKLLLLPEPFTAAFAGSPSAPTATNPYITKAKLLTAGETINGGTLPVPVFQNKTDNEFYTCDGNDTSNMKFLGFAISNGTDGNSMYVQFTGIVGGFSALDEGEKYYLSDTAGTISTTPGTYEVLVGVAISTTELLIQRGRRFRNGTGTFSDAGGDGQTQTSVITLGFRPSVIRLTTGTDSGSSVQQFGSGTWVNGVYASTRLLSGSTSDASTSTSYIANPRNEANTEGWRFTITSVTDTGFTFTVAQQGISPDPVHYSWEAEGEL
jgi:hypothetical protein